MNQEAITRFLVDHGPIRDDSPSRPNAIKKAWEMAQAQVSEHPELQCTLAAWGFHAKNLEDNGRVIVERPSPRKSTSINVAAFVKEEMVSSAPVITEAKFTPAANAEPASPEPADVIELPPMSPPLVPSTVGEEPMVKIGVELPASRAAQILAELSELPPPAVLEPSQIAVLIDGYRSMTQQLQNFVAETFAAWMEMTEKIDRIEAVLTDSADSADSSEPPRPITAVVAVDGAEPVELTEEKKDKRLRPRLSEVPNSVSDKDLRHLYGMAAAQGYTIERSNGGHIKVIPADGQVSQETLVGPATPSDHRSIKNLRAQLRRAGVEV